MVRREVLYAIRRYAVHLALLGVVLSALALISAQNEQSSLRAIGAQLLAPTLPSPAGENGAVEKTQPSVTIIAVTPTYKRMERLADMTRLAQTLSHIPNLLWVVVEDANKTAPVVDRLLNRTGLDYVYLNTVTPEGMPKRGWAQRNEALRWIRAEWTRRNNPPGVLYFCDDDNAYDVRLFPDYVSRVRTVGFWAVGMVGSAAVEAPHVEKGKITAWDVVYSPKRIFATDMAGFAVNMRLVQAKNATFHAGCKKTTPESCFLQQIGVPKEEAQPFGWDSNPKEVLVWHTKTRGTGSKGGNHGYVVEI